MVACALAVAKTARLCCGTWTTANICTRWTTTISSPPCASLPTGKYLLPKILLTFFEVYVMKNSLTTWNLWEVSGYGTESDTKTIFSSYIESIYTNKIVFIFQVLVVCRLRTINQNLGLGKQGNGWRIETRSCLSEQQGWASSMFVFGLVHWWTNFVRWIFRQHHQGVASQRVRPLSF